MNPECKIYIGGLPDEASKFDLEDSFSRIGRVRDVWVARKPPGFAFVEMEDKRDAEDAVRELDGTRMCGNRVKVELSNGRRGGGGRGGGRGGRGGFGGRSRSRSGGRGRSRSRSGGRRGGRRSRSRSGGRRASRRSPSYRSMSRGRDRSRSGGRDRKRSRSR